MKHADNVITSLNIITYYNNFLQCYELLYHRSRVSCAAGIRKSSLLFVCSFVFSVSLLNSGIMLTTSLWSLGVIKLFRNRWIREGLQLCTAFNFIAAQP